MSSTKASLCPICKTPVSDISFSYNSPPKGETSFDLRGQIYKRFYYRCSECFHEFSKHDMDLSCLYEGTYVQSTYGDKMRATFERIISLPPGTSDNTNRVQRVLDFAADFFPHGFIPNLLDIGSGLGVFPYRMKESGWQCTALDPDAQAGRHLAEVVGVSVVTGDFLHIDFGKSDQFNVITLNKVIEHVQDPVAMLTKAASYLHKSGFLYVEVPDVAASIEGPEREEYFIEHLHVFSPESTLSSADRAGLKVLTLERLKEPSGKYTIIFFAVLK